MIDDLKIFCKNTQEYIDIDGGDTLQQIYETIEKRIPFRPICALVNNKVEGLGYPVFGPKMVEYLEPTSSQGSRVYVHSLCMILYKAIEDLFPCKRLRIEHSISGGYAYNGRWGKTEGKKGFEPSITRLQEQGYVLISDFVYQTDRLGNRHGWGVAAYDTPERFWGDDFTDHVYTHTPAESYELLLAHLSELLPETDTKALKRFLK